MLKTGVLSMRALSFHSRSLPHLRPTRIAALTALAAMALVAPAAASQHAPPRPSGHAHGRAAQAASAQSATAQAAAMRAAAGLRLPVARGSGAPPSASLIVSTSAGAVEGRSTADNVNEFLGIPYAAPPA